MEEPISVLTNIFYIIVGIAVQDILLTPALIGLGITSAGYHWTKEWVWQKWDVRFMYVVMPLVFYGMFLSDILLFLTSAITIYFLWYYHASSTYVSIIWFILVVVAGLILGYDMTFIPVFIVAGLCNIPFLFLNWDKVITDMLHGLWHLFTALGFSIIIAF